MLFHEIYGSYFRVASMVLDKACAGTLDEKQLNSFIRQHAFGESALTIPDGLKNEWHLLTDKFSTPLNHAPAMPLTTLEKRWLRALLSDPRIALFGVSDAGLEDIPPLYTADTFEYFDRYTDGDPYHDAHYIANFKTALAAIRHRQIIEVVYKTKQGAHQNRVCVPWRFEYSAKDDKFRLLATAGKNTYIFNMARVRGVDILGDAQMCSNPPCAIQRHVTLALTDERNALERLLLHFSHLKKETVRLDDMHYQITLYYDKDDETEILIRILSFGPKIRVMAPDRFILLIKQRLMKQKSCELE